MTWRLLLRILVAFAFGVLVYADALRKDDDHRGEIERATANSSGSGQATHPSARQREMDALSLVVAEFSRQAARNWRAGHTIQHSVRLAVATTKAANLLRRAYARKN